jgi:toxin FitB
MQSGQRPLPAVDSLLAATAKVYGLILATRNVGDLRTLDVQIVNPFEFEAQL